MSRTIRNRRAHPYSRPNSRETFRCRHCRVLVGALPSGGRFRNHCPRCLYSRHVDGDRPGDRTSDCGESMPPIGVFVRPKGEHVLVHRCLGCGLERHNRIAADDDFALILRLPLIEPRLGGRRRKPPFEMPA
ncbi:MAG TPA: RNHCP domain-containing protein [Dehalococcoidia bacterium]|nr:RNHCP domain-containing protein [Dehalococcoidia bacterium]